MSKVMDIKMRLSPALLDLQDLSSTAAALYFWEKPAAKAKVKKFFIENDGSRFSGFNDLSHMVKGWQKINESVFEDFARLKLPADVSRIMADRIDLIGMKIFCWGEHVLKEVNCSEIELISEIQWTSFGTVNESKTFQSALKKNPKISTLDFACLYAQKDYIKKNMKTLFYEVKCLYPQFNFKKVECNVYVIVTMYVCWCFGKSTIGANQVYKNIRKLQSPASELFRICLMLGFTKAAKYFYSKIKKESKKEFLVEAASECLKFNQQVTLGDYRKEKIAELLIFLLDNMEHSDKVKFLTGNLIDILKLFAYLWPYQKFCMPVINLVWPWLSESDHEGVLDTILSCLLTDSLKKHQVSKKIHQKILQEILKKISYAIVVKKFHRQAYWCELFRTYDFSTLCIIVSNSNVLRIRDKLLEMSLEDFKTLIADGKYEIVDKYVELLCLSDEEKNKFKSRFDNLLDYVKNGHLDKADEFLNWRCNSPEEKIKLKQEIDPSPVIKTFTHQNKIELRDKFVNWYFNFSKEKNSVKKTMNESLCKEMFGIWCRASVCGSDFAKDKCYDFLKSFLKTEEEIISFKKEAFFEKNDKFVKIFCDRLDYPEHFETINDLFDFCLIKPEAVEEIKRKIIKNIDTWVESYGIKTDKFLILNNLIDWVVRDDAQKKKIIENFFDSPKGAVLCISVLNYCKYKKEGSVLKLFNGWIKPHCNVFKIKEQLKDMKNGKVTDNNVVKVLKLLDKLEENGTLTSFNIKCVVSNHTESDSLKNGLGQE